VDLPKYGGGARLDRGKRGHSSLAGRHGKALAVHFAVRRIEALIPQMAARGIRLSTTFVFMTPYAVPLLGVMIWVAIVSPRTISQANRVH